jgi:hypothetical protein
MMPSNGTMLALDVGDVNADGGLEKGCRKDEGRKGEDEKEEAVCDAGEKKSSGSEETGDDSGSRGEGSASGVWMCSGDDSGDGKRRRLDDEDDEPL